MNLLLWVTIGFITIGFAVLNSMKKGAEGKFAFITDNMEDKENSTKAKFIIWWIVSTTGWGIVSMFLIVWCFHHYIG